MCDSDHQQSDFEEISDREEYKEVNNSSNNGLSMEEEYEKLYETYGTESYGKIEDITDFADWGHRYVGESGKWGEKWGLINDVNKIQHLIHLQNESEQKIARFTKIMQESETPAKHVSEKLGLYTTRQNKLPAKIEQLEQSIVRTIDYFMKDAICFIIKYMKHPDNQSVIRITDAINFYEKRRNKKILSEDEKKQILELEKKKKDLSNQISKKQFTEIEGVDRTVKELEKCCKTLKNLQELQFDIKSADLSSLVSEIETKIKEYSGPEKKEALWKEYYDLWGQRGGVYEEIAIISGDLDQLYDLLYLSQYDNCIWCEFKSFYYLMKLPKITSDKKLKLHEPYITGQSFFENNLELYCKSPKIIEICKHFFMHLRYIPKRAHEPL